MPLALALVSFFLGIAIPWRLTVTAVTAAIHPGLFDLLFLPAGAVILWSDLRDASRERRILLLKPFLLPLLLALIPLGHALAGSAAGPLPALATTYAILAGCVLTLADRALLLQGLRAGLIASVIVACLLAPWRPDLVFEHHYFAGMTGAKNTFAFLVGVVLLEALQRRPGASNRAGTVRQSLEICAWFALLLASNARAATGAVVFAALLPLIRKGAKDRRTLALTGILALAGFAFLATASVPHDRLLFAQAILTHAADVPLWGVGPGYGYGLDFYCKTFLELGIPGAVLLTFIVLRALRKGVDPLLAFLLIFGIAHDPSRWPLAWLLLVPNEFTAETAEYTEEI